MPAGGNKHPGQGFKPGHPPYYTGGSVPGHAPTCRNGEWKKGMEVIAAQRNDPGSASYPYRFDQPLGKENRRKGGNRPKDKERLCLEAIQRSKDPDSGNLARHYPPGLFKRMKALHDVASNPKHKDFMHAVRLVREILSRHRGENEKTKGAEESGASIAVIRGRVDVPMPGAERTDPDAQGGAPGSVEQSEG